MLLECTSRYQAKGRLQQAFGDMAVVLTLNTGVVGFASQVPLRLRGCGQPPDDKAGWAIRPSSALEEEFARRFYKSVRLRGSALCSHRHARSGAEHVQAWRCRAHGGVTSEIQNIAPRLLLSVMSPPGALIRMDE